MVKPVRLLQWVISPRPRTCYSAPNICSSQPELCGYARRSAALRDLGPAYDRFGSEADLKPPPNHVRFTPQSGQSADTLACPLRAISGLMQCSIRRGRISLFDHLVGGGE